MTSSRIFSDVVDVVVVGDGLVGLACARAVAARGASICLVGRRRPGVASAAAGGCLVPTIDPARDQALVFTLTARDAFRTYIETLGAATGQDIPLAMDGILRLPVSEEDAAELAAHDDTLSRWLTPDDVSHLEPALAAPLGARFHAEDGVVDNRRFLEALDAAVALGGLPRLDDHVARVEFVGDDAAVELESGRRIRCRHLVLASGAWAPLTKGLPTPLPVRPLRGQMMALAAVPSPPIRRPVFGAGGYLVPRAHDREIFVGSTSEAAGYAVGTTDQALAGFRLLARQLVPALARADELRTWSGLRPMTLDGLPILGRDPTHPALLYACGHSRNGVLLAPITGDVIAALVAGEEPPHDISAFSISRFSEGIGVQS